jgi:hypothetical protein
VSGQRHARPCFSPGERIRSTNFTGVWVDLRAGLDTEVRGKILSPLPGIEPRSPGHPVRGQTLYWLSYPAHNHTVALVEISSTRILLNWRHWYSYSLFCILFPPHSLNITFHDLFFYFSGLLFSSILLLIKFCSWVRWLVIRPCIFILLWRNTSRVQMLLVLEESVKHKSSFREEPSLKRWKIFFSSTTNKILFSHEYIRFTLTRKVFLAKRLLFVN